MKVGDRIAISYLQLIKYALTVSFPAPSEKKILCPEGTTVETDKGPPLGWKQGMEIEKRLPTVMQVLLDT